MSLTDEQIQATEIQTRNAGRKAVNNVAVIAIGGVLIVVIVTYAVFKIFPSDTVIEVGLVLGLLSLVSIISAGHFEVKAERKVFFQVLKEKGISEDRIHILFDKYEKKNAKN